MNCRKVQWPSSETNINSAFLSADAELFLSTSVHFKDQYHKNIFFMTYKSGKYCWMGRLGESFQHFHLPLYNYKNTLTAQLLKTFHVYSCTHTFACLPFQPIHCFCIIDGMHFSLMNKIQAESWVNKHTVCALCHSQPELGMHQTGRTSLGNPRKCRWVQDGDSWGHRGERSVLIASERHCSSTEIGNQFS